MLKSMLGEARRSATPLIAIALLVVSYTSCSPQLTPRVRRLRVPATVQESELIVIGGVTAVRRTERVAQTPDARRWAVRLVEVGISVENILKGRRRASTIQFYYYYPEGAFSLPSVNIVNPGDRAIFFLVEDRGVERSVNDVFASCIHLMTGSHPELSGVPQMSAEKAIALACLLPGTKGDLDLRRWPYGLESGARISDSLIGRSQTITLLESLLSYPDYRVSIEACLAIASLSPTKPKCVDQLHPERWFDPEFEHNVRYQYNSLLTPYHQELGTPLPSKWPVPPPGIPPVAFSMKGARPLSLW